PRAARSVRGAAGVDVARGGRRRRSFRLTRRSVRLVALSYTKGGRLAKCSARRLSQAHAIVTVMRWRRPATAARPSACTNPALVTAKAAEKGAAVASEVERHPDRPHSENRRARTKHAMGRPRKKSEEKRR